MIYNQIRNYNFIIKSLWKMIRYKKIELMLYILLVIRIKDFYINHKPFFMKVKLKIRRWMVKVDLKLLIIIIISFMKDSLKKIIWMGKGKYLWNKMKKSLLFLECGRIIIQFRSYYRMPSLDKQPRYNFKKNHLIKVRLFFMIIESIKGNLDMILINHCI